jgi:hypothetical protein
MEKEFVPYELALRLGSLGFDEPCIAWYVSKSYGLEYGKVIKPDLIKEAVLAPLFSQAFRWFREKYGIVGYCYIQLNIGMKLNKKLLTFKTE